MQFIINQISAKVRKATLRGRKYLVAPAVAVREKVLNGEFLPEEEIAAFVEAWNGIPLVIDHPEEDGKHISANSPDIPNFGRFWHAEMDGDKLKGEMWFDLAALQQAGSVGEQIRKRLVQGELIELSTAYFRDLEKKSGVHDGERYSGIQRNLRPDHLAVLPNDVGACSIKDGCGVPRAHSTTSKGGTMKINEFLALIGEKAGLMVNVDEETEEISVEEIEQDDEEDQPEGNPGESDSETEPTANSGDAPEGVAELIKLVGQMNQTLGQVVTDVKGLKANVQSVEDQEKANLVTSLAANQLCPLSEKELKDMPLEVLKTLGKSYQVNDYSGRGLFEPPATNEDQVAIPAPVLFAKPKAEKEA